MVPRPPAMNGRRRYTIDAGASWLIELSRKYRAIREPIRLSVRQWYALILRVRRRKYAGSLSSTQPDGAAVGVSPGECLFSSAYDVESRAWASNVLHHNLRADF